MLAQVVLGGLRGLTDASLVGSTDTEAVDSALLQVRHRALAVGVRRLQNLLPIHGELVLHLDVVVGDGAAAVLLGGSPPELHRLVVVVDDLGLAGPAWLICGAVEETR